MAKLTTTSYVTKIVTIIFSLAFFGLGVFFFFYNTFTFNYESYLNQQYSLVFWLPVLAITLIWLYRSSQYFSYKLSISLLFIAIVCSFLYFSYYYSFGNEYFFTIIIIALACYGVFLLGNAVLVQLLVIALLLAFAIKLYLGIQQQFNTQGNNGLLITGSLQNSGVYAYYLVFNLPFFYWFCLNFSKQFFLGEKKFIADFILNCFYAVFYYWYFI